MNSQSNPLPPIVSLAQWKLARQQLLVKEKAATRARDALAAERRRLPMVKVDKDYAFEGDEGSLRFLDLFDQRRQLIVIHFMFHPTWSEGCEGCSMTVDSLGHRAHLQARDTSLVLMSRAPYVKLKAYRERMGWTVPWYSSFGSDFNVDFDVTKDDKEQSAVSVFLRDGASVYLDLTPYGRQETWEDSPPGWPQSAPYAWWKRHDQYESRGAAADCGCQR